MRYQTAMLEALKRIKKRLGGQRYVEIRNILEQALINDDLNLDRDWIVRLLREYYDPMYDYQIENKSHRIVLEGNEAELTEYLQGKDLEIG